MKAASVHEIRQALKNNGKEELINLCLQLARFKKENKELLTYLLYEAGDERTYIKNVKEVIDEGFREINISHLYYAKKTLRKILRLANKYIRYSGNKTTEVEILLHYCTSFKGLKLNLKKSAALSNLYASQIKKISAAIAGLHEDLQYDYLKELKRVE